MLILPDINIWLAFAVETHPHHPLVKQKWSTLQGHDLAFCRVTQMGFLRLLTNPRAMGPSVRDSKSAWEMHDKLVHQQKVTWRPEPDNLETFWRKITAAPDFTHHLWTDAYLAAFATAANMSVLTLDKDFKNFTGTKIIFWS